MRTRSTKGSIPSMTVGIDDSLPERQLWAKVLLQTKWDLDSIVAKIIELDKKISRLKPSMKGYNNIYGRLNSQRDIAWRKLEVLFHELSSPWMEEVCGFVEVSYDRLIAYAKKERRKIVLALSVP